MRSLLSVAFALLVICPQSFSAEVRNVIFMIGDGMGLNHMYAGMTENGGKLNLEKAEFTGIQKTFSGSHYITDSAAGGTALACGIKTTNGFIGMSSDKKPVPSILELAAENGLATGIVVTSSLTDATPASYASHQPSRKLHEEIAADMAAAKVDFMVGGGRKYFQKRKDGKDLVKEMEGQGKNVVFTLEEVLKADKLPLIGILADGNLPEMVKGRSDMLPKATKKAIEELSRSEKGFFLMVEGSHIDKCAHGNDGPAVVQEMLDFDKAVGAAISFAQKDGNTLVIVTADHETGGMAVMEGDFAEKEVEVKFTTGGHTGVPVIVYSFGPGASKFSGVIDNTIYKEKLAELMGLRK